MTDGAAADAPLLVGRWHTDSLSTLPGQYLVFTFDADGSGSSESDKQTTRFQWNAQGSTIHLSYTDPSGLTEDWSYRQSADGNVLDLDMSEPSDPSHAPTTRFYRVASTGTDATKPAYTELPRASAQTHLGLSFVALPHTPLGYYPSSGLRVTSVDAGGSAARAGLQSGDVIMWIDGRVAVGVDAMNSAKAFHHAGDVLALKVWRDGSVFDCNVILEGSQ